MRRYLFLLLLIFAVSILAAVESDPSETVGYVKYDALTGLNLVAMPMDDGLMFCSEVGTYMSPDDYVDTINLWNNATQSYDAAVNYGGGFWDPDYPVSIGTPMFISSSSAITWPAGPRGTGLSTPSTSRK
jgi:hypothetical protein